MLIILPCWRGINCSVAGRITQRCLKKIGSDSFLIQRKGRKKRNCSRMWKWFQLFGNVMSVCHPAWCWWWMLGVRRTNRADRQQANTFIAETFKKRLFQQSKKGC